MCLECNFINPLSSLLLIDTEVSSNHVHICAPCFSRLCLEATRGLLESALDEKYLEDTKMLLLQLRCTIFACVIDCDDSGEHREGLCPAAVCATSWAVFQAGPLAHT